MTMKAHVCGLCDMPFPYQCQTCNLAGSVGVPSDDVGVPVREQAMQVIRKIFVGSGEDVCLEEVV